MAYVEMALARMPDHDVLPDFKLFMDNNKETFKLNRAIKDEWDAVEAAESEMRAAIYLFSILVKYFMEKKDAEGSYVRANLLTSIVADTLYKVHKVPVNYYFAPEQEQEQESSQEGDPPPPYDAIEHCRQGRTADTTARTKPTSKLLPSTLPACSARSPNASRESSGNDVTNTKSVHVDSGSTSPACNQSTTTGPGAGEMDPTTSRSGLEKGTIVAKGSAVDKEDPISLEGGEGEGGDLDDAQSPNTRSSGRKRSFSPDDDERASTTGPPPATYLAVAGTAAGAFIKKDVGEKILTAVYERWPDHLVEVKKVDSKQMTFKECGRVMKWLQEEVFGESGLMRLREAWESRADKHQHHDTSLVVSEQSPAADLQRCATALNAALNEAGKATCSSQGNFRWSSDFAVRYATLEETRKDPTSEHAKELKDWDEAWLAAKPENRRGKGQKTVLLRYLVAQKWPLEAEAIIADSGTKGKNSKWRSKTNTIRDQRKLGLRISAVTRILGPGVSHWLPPDAKAKLSLWSPEVFDELVAQIVKHVPMIATVCQATEELSNGQGDGPKLQELRALVDSEATNPDYRKLGSDFIDATHDYATGAKTLRRLEPYKYEPNRLLTADGDEDTTVEMAGRRLLTASDEEDSMSDMESTTPVRRLLPAKALHTTTPIDRTTPAIKKTAPGAQARTDLHTDFGELLTHRRKQDTANLRPPRAARATDTLCTVEPQAKKATTASEIFQGSATDIAEQLYAQSTAPRAKVAPQRPSRHILAKPGDRMRKKLKLG